MATKTPTTTDKKSVYEIVTEQILTAMEQGVAPWRRPWQVNSHQNGVSKRPYRGLNALLLGLTEYTDPRWFTYRQASELGGQVRKGEKGHLVVFWKPSAFKETDPVTQQETERIVPLLRYYVVFNAAQIDGLELSPVVKPLDFHPLEQAQNTIDAFLKQGGIQYEEFGDRACYSPMLDTIRMPKPETFRTVEDFYLTLFHEAGHSTGHPSRLDRFKPTVGVLAHESYGREELIAEMTAAFLAAETGIPNTLESSASYLEGWRKAIKADVRMIVVAAGKAAKAADLILGRAEAHKTQQEVAA